MLVVLLVAIPMYVCATGSIPIAMSLILKGLSPGTAFVLLMAGPAANFASFTLIAREMGRKAAAVYLASIVAGAVAFGLAIDYLLPAAWFGRISAQTGACHDAGAGPFSYLCSALLVGLLLAAFVKRRVGRRTGRTATTREYRIEGMRCAHCQYHIFNKPCNLKYLVCLNRSEPNDQIFKHSIGIKGGFLIHAIYRFEHWTPI